MNRQIEMVHQFMTAFEQPHNHQITSKLPYELKQLRINLIREELIEYETACLNEDIIEIADALMDILYVVFGAILVHGLADKAEELFKNVHESNITKELHFGDSMIKDGRVKKGKDFCPPDIKSVLER